jgi:hypothetical protein
MNFFQNGLYYVFLIYMISTCAGIDKYAFYLDFKGVLSSKPQASVNKCTCTIFLAFNGTMYKNFKPVKIRDVYFHYLHVIMINPPTHPSFYGFSTIYQINDLFDSWVINRVGSFITLSF